MRLLLTSTALAAASLGLAAAPAYAQMKPAGHDDVVAAIEACQTIATPTWIELDALPDMGWHAAKKRGERRRTQVLRGIYEKRGNEAYVVVGGDEIKEKSCVVLARLASTDEYIPLVQQLATSHGMPSRQDGPVYFWDGADKSMSVEPSGERSAPNMKITIKAFKESAE